MTHENETHGVLHLLEHARHAGHNTLTLYGLVEVLRELVEHLAHLIGV